MAAASLLEMGASLQARFFPTLSAASVERLVSPQWWLESVLAAYKSDPEHVLIEFLCIAIILYLLMRPSYDPRQTDELSQREEDALIADWRPDPVTHFEGEGGRDASSGGAADAAAAELDESEPLVVKGVVGARVEVEGGRTLANFCSNNFAGLAGHPEVIAACEAAVDKYGVGSCGPRGFYGTIDVHLELEKALAEFYGMEEAILYSDSMALMASVIPAFSKKGDLLICDEAVHFGIQQGVALSRSNVLYYRHNDMEDLERVLQEVREKDALRDPKKLYRRFIVTEGLSREHGDVCPLDKVVDLKNHYKYRLMVDDTLALGVLGKTGRGTAEHFGVDPEEIHFLCAGTEAALGGVGGVCCGSHEVVDHQRLSGLGYCFSASSPPYTAVAGTTALAVLLREPDRAARVRDRAALLRRLVSARAKGVRVTGGAEPTGQSPCVHVRLAKSRGSAEADRVLMHIVRQKMIDAGVVVEVLRHVPRDRLSTAPATLRLTVSADHSEDDVRDAADKLAASFAEAMAL